MNLTYAIGSGQGWAADWEPYGNSRERSEALVRQAFAELERETRSTFATDWREPDVWVIWRPGDDPMLQFESKENRGIFWPRGWKIPGYGYNNYGNKGLIVFNQDRRLGFDLDWKRYGASPPTEWDGPICADAWHPYQRRAIGAVWHELGHALNWQHQGPNDWIASGNFTASYFHIDEYPRVHARFGKPSNWRPLELVQWGDALRDIRALWMNEHRTTSVTEVREKRNRLAELRAATPNPDHRYEIHAAIVRINEQLRAYQTAAVNWHMVNKEW